MTSDGKNAVSLDALTQTVVDTLADIQSSLFRKALERREAMTSEAATMAEFEEILDSKSGFIVAPTDGTDESEKAIKDKTKATIRIVLADEGVDGTCIVTGKPASRRALFARAY